MVKVLKFSLLLKLFFLSIIIISCFDNNNNNNNKPQPIYKYGYDLSKYRVINDTIRYDETLGIILDRHHVSYPTIYNIVNQIKDSFDVRRIKIGKPYTILLKKDSTQQAQVFIYQPNAVEYAVIDFKDSIIKARNNRKPTEIRIKRASGIITDSFFETLDSQNINPMLALELSDIFTDVIDFYRLNKYDKFKAIYEQEYVDDTISVGIGKIHAAYFENNKIPFYAFNYKVDSIMGNDKFYDDKAQNLRKAILMSPIKLSDKIRNKKTFSKRGYFLGTDFIALAGTPVVSTSNGKVLKSSYTNGNHKYVIIEYSDTYSMKYLHMSKTVVKAGDEVKQGQTIGFVGGTKNTKGHMRYCLWKNGKQIDAFHEKLPSINPLSNNVKSQYLKFANTLKNQLDSIKYP